MIGKLTGPVVDEQEDRIIVDASGVGYEVLVPIYQMQVLRARHLPPEDPKARLKGSGTPIQVYIHTHVPERKPVPVLFGFNDPMERRFFEMLAGVSRFGPMAAMKSMVISVPEYASRIMTRDVRRLSQLPGIGQAKAEQIVAQLRSKVAVFAMMAEEKLPDRPYEPEEESLLQAQIALEDLGYRAHEAEAMVRAAHEAQPKANTAEELLAAVWTLQRDKK